LAIAYAIDRATAYAIDRATAYAIDRATISRELVGCSSIVIHSACFPSQFCCTQDVLKYRYVPVLE
jgi:peptide/nickel transport system substrate-binding protein